jgi:hypothetical protein
VGPKASLDTVVKRKKITSLPLLGIKPFSHEVNRNKDKSWQFKIISRKNIHLENI